MLYRYRMYHLCAIDTMPEDIADLMETSESSIIYSLMVALDISSLIKMQAS